VLCGWVNFVVPRNHLLPSELTLRENPQNQAGKDTGRFVSEDINFAEKKAGHTRS